MAAEKPNREVLEALTILGEPVFLIENGSGKVYGNRAFLSFIGHEASNLSLKDFWPGYLESDLSEGSCISTFRLASEELISVKLYSASVGKELVLVRLVASRARPDSEQGFHLQRMETLGALSGGIAHDMNNIVTGILGHLAYLKMTLPKTGPHLDSLQAIEDGANRSAQMARQILSYVKQESSAEPVEIDLTQAVESTCNLLRGAISKRYKLIYEVPPHPVKVKAVEGQFTQVIINLAVNARDALQPNGEIRVVLRELETNEVIDPVGEIRGVERLKGRYACLSVLDNGDGIPEDILVRIFEPYFSTKKDRGTGLGLATVKEIVDHSGGVIEISSKPGIGTKVSVYLPIVEDEEVEEASDLDIDIRGARERILVVDDEQTVRNVLSLSLRRLGYEVEIASSGSQALTKFSDARSNYDLVILDMVMPELSGKDVFFRLKEIDPEVRVLVCSAYASEKSIQEILQNGGRGFIQKPFDVEDLALKIKDCLVDT